MQWLARIWHEVASWPVGWFVAAALAAVGIWREISGWHAKEALRAEARALRADVRALAKRLDAIESGATYREMEEFVARSMRAVSEAEHKIERMRAEIAESARKLAESQRRLGEALLEGAKWEERVQRMLAGQRT